MLALKESDIPSAYDSCNGKVDAFLDWFFGIATNNSVRSSISKEDARQTMQDYFYDLVGSDADAQLTKQVNDCVETARAEKTSGNRRRLRCYPFGRWFPTFHRGSLIRKVLRMPLCSTNANKRRKT